MFVCMTIKSDAPKESKKFFADRIAKGFMTPSPYRDTILKKASDLMEGNVADKDRAILKRCEGAFGGNGDYDRQIRFYPGDMDGSLGLDVQDGPKYCNDAKYTVEELSVIFGSLAKAIEEDIAQRFGWHSRYFDSEKKQDAFLFYMPFGEDIGDQANHEFLRDVRS